jgi:hypothetical protein
MTWPEAFVAAVAIVCGTFLLWRIGKALNEGMP